MVLGFIFLLASVSSTNTQPNSHDNINEDDVADLKDLLHSSMQSIVLLDDLVTKLTGKVADLTISFADTKADMRNLKTSVGEDMADLKTSVEEYLKATPREVMIVSGEEEPGETRCARVCAGTTGRGTTTWTDASSHGVKLSVDISRCGFVKVPTVTTSVEGKNAQWRATGLAGVYTTTTTSFDMWVEGLQHSPTGGSAEAWGWNVEWVAVGYIC